MKIGLVLIHFVTILAPVAIVGAEVPVIRAEVAAVAIDLALIGANDLTGAAERFVMLSTRPTPNSRVIVYPGT